MNIGNRSGTSDKYGNQLLLRSSIARRTTSTTGTKKLKNNQFLFTNSPIQRQFRGTDKDIRVNSLLSTDIGVTWSLFSSGDTKDLFTLITTRPGYSIQNRGFKKPKFSQSRVVYYSNTDATRRILLLSGDIELNPGWDGLHQVEPPAASESGITSGNLNCIPVHTTNRLGVYSVTKHFS